MTNNDKYCIEVGFDSYVVLLCSVERYIDDIERKLMKTNEEFYQEELRKLNTLKSEISATLRLKITDDGGI